VRQAGRGSVGTTAKRHAMRWFEAALAARRVARRLERRRLVAGALAAAACLAFAGAGAAAPKAPTVPNARAGGFTGYGFASCNAPSLDELTAWLASPYRAVGIYIGGASRSCANAELSPVWVAGALSGGWSLIPTYVGLQAPCVSSSARKSRFTAANAQSQGTA